MTYLIRPETGNQSTKASVVHTGAVLLETITDRVSEARDCTTIVQATELLGSPDVTQDLKRGRPSSYRQLGSTLDHLRWRRDDPAGQTTSGSRYPDRAQLDV